MRDICKFLANIFGNRKPKKSGMQLLLLGVVVVIGTEWYMEPLMFQ